MKKLQIKIPLILPELSDEKDQCVHRLIDQLQDHDGLEKIHIADDNETPKLCFHYNPQIISIERIQSLISQTGTAITKKFGHKLIEVEGIRHTRHARLIERNLQHLNGIIEANVSASGIVRIEFEKSKTNESKIFQALSKEGLRILDNDVTAKEYSQHLKRVDADQKTSQEHLDEHELTSSGILGKNTDLIFSIICGVSLATGFVFSFVDSIPNFISLTLYAGAYLFGGFYAAKEALETLLKGGFEIDFLMLVAAIGAGILGEWAEGALLLFLFSMGHALEHFAMNKAHKSIAALAELAPKTALLKKNDETREVSIEELQINDIIVVKPNSKIPADGVVVSGSSSVNQAPITGESVPVDKVTVTDPNKEYAQGVFINPENKVFAGTINGNNTLEVKVIKTVEDSTLARLVRLVNEAQTQKSPTQQFSEKFEKYFVPVVLVVVGILNFAFLVIDETFKESFYRAMAALVAASPCALAISTPSAVLSGVARAAKGGVLIKGGRPLEDLGVLTAIAFDKTGTLTEGNPKLIKTVALGGLSDEDVLKIAVAVEGLSDHPLAKAVVRDGTQLLNGIDVPEAKNLEAVLGKGIKASLGKDQILVGNLELYESLDVNKPSAEIIKQVKTLESEGHTTMLIRQNENYIGILALMDTPRKQARATLDRLKQLGIKRMIMLTGDNQNVADAVANEIGLTDAWGSLLPEEKVKAIKELRQKESRVAMVGDGVNDAPAMAHSTVGIAMGAAGSDVALETADIALMADKLETLPFAIGLSRKAKQIIKQNVWISLGVVALLVPATIVGWASMGWAVLFHEGSTIVVVFNALRLLAYKEKPVI